MLLNKIDMIDKIDTIDVSIIMSIMSFFSAEGGSAVGGKFCHYFLCPKLP